MTKKELEKQLGEAQAGIEARDAQILRLEADLERETYQSTLNAQRANKAEKLGIMVWDAHSIEHGVPVVCVSADSEGTSIEELSIDFIPAEPPYTGMIVFDGTRLVAAFGDIPAEIMLHELEHSRKFESE